MGRVVLEKVQSFCKFQIKMYAKVLRRKWEGILLELCYNNESYLFIYFLKNAFLINEIQKKFQHIIWFYCKIVTISNFAWPGV